MKPLKLEVLFGSQDKLSPALKLMVGSSNAASKALKATRDEIKTERSAETDRWVY